MVDSVMNKIQINSLEKIMKYLLNSIEIKEGTTTIRATLNTIIYLLQTPYANINYARYHALMKTIIPALSNSSLDIRILADRLFEYVFISFSYNMTNFLFIATCRVQHDLVVIVPGRTIQFVYGRILWKYGLVYGAVLLCPLLRVNTVRLRAISDHKWPYLAQLR